MINLLELYTLEEGDGAIHVNGINKGGSAKTTTTVNEATMLTLLGARVLVIDSGPEAHTTYSLGYIPREIKHSLFDLLAGRCSLRDAIVPTYYHPELRSFFNPTYPVNPGDPASKTVLQQYVDQGVQVIRGPDLIPVRFDLESDEVLRGRQMREFLLAFALHPLRKVYQYMILDTNPDLSNLLTINAIYAADWVCIPFVPDSLNAMGFENILEAIISTQKKVNKKLQIAGVLMSRVRDLKAHRDILDPFRAILDENHIHYFQTQIKDDPNKFMSASNRRSVVVLDNPLSDPALDFWSFLAEYLAIVGGPAKDAIGSTLQGLRTQRELIAKEKERQKLERIAKRQGTSGAE
ncbi:MAG TPA: AAA family ATPase [Ktedonobacteraceae bacterium]|nr:AAA family ATPase [Ktedonobacteraceae bacterium]